MARSDIGRICADHNMRIAAVVVVIVVGFEAEASCALESPCGSLFEIYICGDKKERNGVHE